MTCAAFIGVLFSEVLRSNQLRSTKKFQAAMSTAAGIASGDFTQIMKAVQTTTSTELDPGDVDTLGQGPQGSTLSKAKYRLDAFLMLCRRELWAMDGLDSRWISLCFPASTYMMCMSMYSLHRIMYFEYQHAYMM